jgi:hypothetical protein
MKEKCWPAMHTAVRGFWKIINPVIEISAKARDIPVDLYCFGELGLEFFSHEDFRERDRFSNPRLFDELFQRLSRSGWIRPVGPERFEVTQEAREAARKIIQSGYDHLATHHLLPPKDANKLAALLERLVQACSDAPEPPRKRALRKRFRVATPESPPIVRIREYLMDLFAYRDDVHLATWESYPVTGLMWNAFSFLWSDPSADAAAMAERMSFRGYETDHYHRALEDLCEVGWVEKAAPGDSFQVSVGGKALRDRVEAKTDLDFYHPWSILSNRESQELCRLLSKLIASLSPC